MHRLHDELDDRHWWFVARRRIVLDVLRRALPADPASATRLRILDIGCGAGATLRELARLGEAYGVDTEPSAVEAAARRSACDVRLGRLPDEIPFAPDSFDLVTLLDVLEHVEDDVGSLRTIARLLVPGGMLLCTVPAYAFLWSDHDVVNQHKRRYTRRELAARLALAGFEIRKLTYYNTLLFPPIAALRLLRHGARRRGGAGADLGEVPAPLNALLRGIMAAERRWLRIGRFPFGVSVLALARKPDALPPHSPAGGARA